MDRVTLEVIGNPDGEAAEMVTGRRFESRVCETLAQREGDRLLKEGDDKGAIACLKVAAMIRNRRDERLEPF